MKPISLKLRAKFLLAFTLILFIPLIFIVWIITNSVIERFNKQYREEVAQSLETVHEKIEIIKDTVRTRIDVISDQKDVQNILIDINKGKDPINIYYDRGYKLMVPNDLDILDILDKDGKIITSGHWKARFGYKDEEDLRISRLYHLIPVFRYEQIEFQNVLSIQVAKTIGLGNESIIVCGGKRIDQDFIDDLAQIAHAKVMLVDKKNLGWIIDEVESKKPSFYNQHNNVYTPDISSKDLENMYSQNKRVEGHLKLGKTSYYFAGIAIKQGDNPFGAIIVAKSEQPLRDLVTEIQRSFVIIALGGAVLAWILAVIVSNRIVVSPIRNLVTGTKEIASGNLDYKIPPTSNDEIGELVKSFNKMSHDLQENKRALIQAERMAAWQEIARRMAHEIKNPLTPIQMSIQTLQKTYRSQHPEFKEIFGESMTTILEEVESIKRIIGEFTELSQRIKPILEKGDVNDIVERSLTLYRGLPESIKINVDLDDDLPDIKYDKDQLGQVMKNLMGNAIDAMPKGGTLAIKTYRKTTEYQGSNRDSIYIEISDTGEGITPENQNKIFTPYFTTKNKGTGLGLAIVYRIVANHGGYITFDSQPNEGTTFRVVLPVES